MLNTKKFGQHLKELGYQFYTGVPCSLLKSLINYAINDCDYIGAVNEGDAVAIAAGAYLGGVKSVVLMQNSGLMNAVSPLTSLNDPFKIPVLGFVSHRGLPGQQDEPQHELTGQITTHLLDLMKIKWEYLADDMGKVKEQLREADRYIEKNMSFFFVVQKGCFDEEKLSTNENSLFQNQVYQGKQKDLQLSSRFETLQVLNKLKDDKTVHLATTGKTGRELYEIGDAPNNFYMVGSMGCVSSLGLGLALTHPDKDMMVIDGDGSLLMRMGSMATIGYYQPHNLLHIVLDNNTHDSTGGQQTVSHNVEFVKVAASCGYEKAYFIHDLDELEECIKKWKNERGLTFLLLKIAKGSKANLGRPTLKPSEVKERLQAFLSRPTH